MAVVSERRRHERVPVRLHLHGRRNRPGFDEPVDAFNLSRGGIRFQFRGDLAVGDTVTLAMCDDTAGISVELEGMIVDVSRWGGGAAAHVAFTVDYDVSDLLFGSPPSS